MMIDAFPHVNDGIALKSKHEHCKPSDDTVLERCFLLFRPALYYRSEQSTLHMLSVFIAVLF